MLTYSLPCSCSLNLSSFWLIQAPGSLWFYFFLSISVSLYIFEITFANDSVF
jgi:hypothetical protein